MEQNQIEYLWPEKPEDVINFAFVDEEGPGYIPLRPEDRKRIMDEQREFYHLIDSELTSSYCALLDRLAVICQKAMAKAINSPTRYSEGASVRAVWKALAERVDEQLLDEHFREFHNVCHRIYNNYHGVQKGSSDSSLAKKNVDLALEDFLALGVAFEEIFGKNDELFMSRDSFKKYLISGYIPVIREDDSSEVLIEKYEKIRESGQSVTKRVILLEIEAAYWKNGNKKESTELLLYSIRKARDDHRIEDYYQHLVRYAHRLIEDGKLLEAINQFESALSICNRFGKDRRYVTIKHVLIKCLIDLDDYNQENVSVWIEELEELYDIAYDLYGDLILAKKVCSTLIFLKVKQDKIVEAIHEILKRKEDFTQNFNPRSQAQFLFACAKTLFGVESSFEIEEFGELDTQVFAKELLDSALELYNKYGEKSAEKEILQFQLEHESNKYVIEDLKTRISRLESDLIAVDARLDVTELDEEYEQYLGHLARSNFREGIRLLIEESGLNIEWWFVDNLDIKSKWIYAIDGDYGTFWRHFDNAARYLKLGNMEIGNASYKHAELKLQKLEDEVFGKRNVMMLPHMRMLEIQLDRRFDFKNDRDAGSKKEEVLRQLVEGWRHLESKRGEYRWKNNLATHLNRQERVKEALEIWVDVVNFYEDRDAANYFYAKTSLIQSRLSDPNVKSSEEWKLLLDSNKIPTASHIQAEIYSRLAVSLTREGNHIEARDFFQKSINSLKEQGSLDLSDELRYRGMLEKEIRNLVEMRLFEEAREKLEEYVLNGWINKSKESSLMIDIFLGENHWNHAIELMWDKFDHDTHNADLKSASFLLQRIVGIYLKQDNMDEVFEVIKKKVDFDRLYNLDGKTSIRGKLHDNTISSSLPLTINHLYARLFARIGSDCLEQEKWQQSLTLYREANMYARKHPKAPRKMRSNYLLKISECFAGLEDSCQSRTNQWRAFHLNATDDDFAGCAHILGRIMRNCDTEGFEELKSSMSKLRFSWRKFSFPEDDEWAPHPNRVASDFRKVLKETIRASGCDRNEVLEVCLVYWNFSIKHLMKNPDDSSLRIHAEKALRYQYGKLRRRNQEKFDKIISKTIPENLEDEEE